MRLVEIYFAELRHLKTNSAFSPETSLSFSCFRTLSLEILSRLELG